MLIFGRYGRWRFQRSLYICKVMLSTHQRWNCGQQVAAKLTLKPRRDLSHWHDEENRVMVNEPAIWRGFTFVCKHKRARVVFYWMFEVLYFIVWTHQCQCTSFLVESLWHCTGSEHTGKSNSPLFFILEQLWVVLKLMCIKTLIQYPSMTPRL